MLLREVCYLCCYTLSFELFRLLVVLGKWPRNVVDVCVGVVGALWLDVVGVVCWIGTIRLWWG